MKDNIWFSPVMVITHFHKLKHAGKFLLLKSSTLKKIKEMYISAVSLVGVTMQLHREFWMQLVDDSEQSPDIRTGCYYKKIRDNDFSTQDIEVVSYSIHSAENITNFLIKTKLKKGYDDLTTILCHVEKISHIPPWEELNKKLHDARLKTKSPVILIGKTDPYKEIYTMAQIYPDIALVIHDFNLADACKQIKTPSVLKLKRSAKSVRELSNLSKEKHYPFERLGIK